MTFTNLLLWELLLHFQCDLWRCQTVQFWEILAWTLLWNTTTGSNWVHKWNQTLNEIRIIVHHGLEHLELASSFTSCKLSLRKIVNTLLAFLSQKPVKVYFDWCSNLIFLDCFELTFSLRFISFFCFAIRNAMDGSNIVASTSQEVIQCQIINCLFDL